MSFDAHKITAAFFDNCRFISNTATSGDGGGLYSNSAQGADLKISHTHFHGNIAAGFGGAIVALQREANTPKNLELGVINLQKFAGQESINLQCYAPVDMTYKKWDYSSPPFVITSTSFQFNRANSGGALYVANLCTELHSCTATANHAATTGGAVFVQIGSATLTVHDTVLQANTALVDGIAIYFLSSAGMSITGTVDISGSSVTFPRGIVVEGGGNVSFGSAEEGTAVACAAGEQLVNSLGRFTQTSNEWQVDCSIYFNCSRACSSPPSTTSAGFIYFNCSVPGVDPSYFSLTGKYTGAVFWNDKPV